MAFEGLSERLSLAFKKLRSKGKLSENDVKEAMREVKLALLEADVNYKVAKTFTNRISESRGRGCDAELNAFANGYKNSKRRTYSFDGAEG